jgi:hypothetical protein
MPYTAFEITGRIPVPDFLSDKNKGLSQVESMLMKYEKKHVLAKMFFSQKSTQHKFKMLYELR